MITLCMDTSQKFLVLALYQDEKLIASCQKDSWKKQSELIFPQLDTLLKSAGYTPQDINQVVVTKGPGSYTGVRIAMTIAKVMCSLGNLPLYSCSTMELVGSLADHCAVVLDARSQRAYFAIVNNGVLEEREQALPLSEIKQILAQRPELTVVGDGSLVGQEDNVGDLAQGFMKCQSCWQQVENIHLLVPEYLKSAEDYLVKKA